MFNNTICKEFDQCGFNLDTDGKCYLPEINPVTEKPIGYLEELYFSQEGCVNWVKDTSCCFNIFKFGEYGNWDCPIISNS